MVADLLDLGQTSKFFDEVTNAIRTAQWENEEQSQGRKHEPKEWEFHIQHWQVHSSELQSMAFRTMPKNVQEIKEDHILGHEMLMFDIAKRNQAFFQKIAALPQFPLFYVDENSQAGQDEVQQSLADDPAPPLDGVGQIQQLQAAGPQANQVPITASGTPIEQPTPQPSEVSGAI